MPLLSPEQKQRFAEDGYILLRGFYEPRSELAPIQRGLYEIIALLAA